MRMYDLIMKKRNGKALTDQEIAFMIHGYAAGNIPDYQMSAMLMAIWFRGMNDHETAVLTDAMARSGDMVDLSPVSGIKVDKHSTGGVGDKTTLIAAPIVASCGVKIAKMSGRGLGHTGGTVDKLESIPGFRTSFQKQEFFDIVNRTGICVAGQSGNLAPADKKLYALRDVTGTVDSIPLIAASIMSKKLAAGSDCILLDVKAGSGAFMKTLKEAVTLAGKMVAIGEHAGRKMAALITNMDIPLGNCIGNALEVIEAVESLSGNGPEDLTDVCLQLAGNMLYLADKGTLDECLAMAREAVDDGRALETLAQMVKAQGGDERVIRMPGRLALAPFQHMVTSPCSGYLNAMNTEAVGNSSALLGAGRAMKEDSIDYGAGIVLKKKTGDFVKEGETLAVMYASAEKRFPEAEQVILDALEFSDEKPVKQPLIYARVENGKEEYFL